MTAGSPLVAIRVPQHPMAIDLLSQLNFPLAAPSANQFGYISPTSAQHVWDSLNERIPYILDGGSTKIGLESTIIGFDENEQVIVHRVGGVSIEDIGATINKTVLVTEGVHEQKPLTAGQLKSHYAPHTPLIIGDIDTLFQKYIGTKVGLISLSNDYSHLQLNTRMILSPTGNLGEAAQKLFAYLRQIDQLNLDVILVEKLPEIGIGRAINDRLHRAQSIFK